jgi:Domain of unknown function (DUF4265)
MRLTTWSPEGLHRYPIWRSRADCVIAAPLPGLASSEQLWARRVGDRLFQVCCIPFLVDDLALGDIVETDRDLAVLRVTTSSGHSTFRARFPAVARSTEAAEEVLTELIRRGATLEWSSTSLLAVDAAARADAAELARYLADCQQRRQLTYRVGKLGWPVGADERWPTGG